MTIKDKDGGVFKLAGPNPVISMQNAWDHSQIVFHNMVFPIIISANERFSDEVIPEEIAAIEIPDTDRTQKLTKLLEKRKVKLLCLPAEKREYEDTLYGSSYVRTQFGQKKTITGVIISTDDLSFVFWTDLPVEAKSIIYPTQTEMKRWWQVDKCEVHAGGFLISCVPSLTSPDFSD